VETYTFDGCTFEENRDGSRLQAQLDRVHAVMADGAWRTLRDLSESCGSPEASVSARLRDLRKPKFGGYEVERRYVRRGLHEYRLVVGQLRLVA
jgi:hypothetical protein